MRLFSALALAGLIALSATPPLLAQEAGHHAAASVPAIPSSLQDEHHELLAALAKTTRLGGRTGAAAKALEATLMPHFEREEEIALPPLGALPRLSQGRDLPERQEVLRLTETLKGEMPRMLSEHKAIAGRLEALEAAARRERKAEAIRFAHQLKAHARTEEELLYPTSLLIGEYLRQQTHHLSI